MTLIASAVVPGVASGVTQADGASASSPVSGVESETEARREALLQGRRIEVLSLRTEATTTYVNSDGTMTTEAYGGPVRVEQEDGSWKAVDTDLTDTGTQLEPQSALVEVEVSDGGDMELASVGDESGTKSFGLGWESKLPTPTVKDDTASYDLGDGQTLTVTALSQGFSQNVVLDAEPDSAPEYRIPLNLEGLTLSVADSGHLLLKDAGGKLVAEAPAPMMWDSSKDKASGESKHQAPVATKVETAEDGSQTLVLTPDADYFEQDLTYPVTVDPTTTLAVTTDTWVATNYNDSQISSTELKSGTYNSGSTVARSFLAFDVSAFEGKQITDTNLALYSYYSSSCTEGSGTVVRRITESWSSSTITWADKPAGTNTGQVINTAAKGYSADCPAGTMNFDIDAIVQAWADGAANYGLLIRGLDETDSLTWRRYRSANYSDSSKAPKLSVTYNTPPTTPTLLSPAAGAYTADATPALSAKATDGDSGSVRVTFQVYDSTGSTLVASGTTAYKASGSTFGWSPASELSTGTYKWRALSYDGSTSSSVSGWRTLNVDTSTPAAPTISSTAYPSGITWNGDAGTSGSFTFATTASNPRTLEYTLDDATAQSVSLSSGSASVSLTPATRGTHTLTARVQNAAGVWSETAKHTFHVGSLSGTVTSDFAAEVAETHFSDILHEAESAAAEEADEDVVPEDITEPDENSEVAPSDFVEEELDEVIEDETSAVADITLSLPGTASGSVTAEDETAAGTTSVALPSSAGSTAEVEGTNLVVYPNTQTDSDTLAVRTAANSIETYHLLRTAAAPTSYSYEVTLAEGQSISQDDDSTLIIGGTSTAPTVMISAPLARDAAGTEIPVALTASGSTVTVSLAPAAGTSIAYPVLLDPDFYGAKLNNTEYKWCTKNNGRRASCISAYGHHGPSALNKAQEYARDGHWSSSSLYLGTGDAFRHCYWNARMVLSDAVGYNNAYAIATNHEATSKGNDRLMDLYNNRKGRLIGDAYKNKDKPYTKVRLKCKAKAKNGELYVVKNGNLIMGTSG